MTFADPHLSREIVLVKTVQCSLRAVDFQLSKLFKNVFRFVPSQIGDGTVANFIFFETNFRSLILSYFRTKKSFLQYVDKWP